MNVTAWVSGTVNENCQYLQDIWKHMNWKKETLIIINFFKIVFIYLRERETLKEREHEQGRGAEGEGQAGSHWAGSPTWDLIPGLWGHDLSQSQMLNWLSHPGPPGFYFFKVMSTLNTRLELMTPRSRVTCSTDWASQAPLIIQF